MNNVLFGIGAGLLAIGLVVCEWGFWLIRGQIHLGRMNSGQEFWRR